MVGEERGERGEGRVWGARAKGVLVIIVKKGVKRGEGCSCTPDGMGGMVWHKICAARGVWDAWLTLTSPPLSSPHPPSPYLHVSQSTTRSIPCSPASHSLTLFFPPLYVPWKNCLQLPKFSFYFWLNKMSAVPPLLFPSFLIKIPPNLTSFCLMFLVSSISHLLHFKVYIP